LAQLSATEYATEVGKLLGPPPRILFKKESFIVIHTVGESFSVDLRGLLASAPSPRIVWSFLQTLPSWLKFNGGVLSGTPQPSDAGVLKLDPIATDGQDSATAKLIVRIQPDQKFPPVWVARPLIPHRHLVVGSPFRIDLTPYVLSAGPDHLRMIKVTGPPWVRVSPQGELVGTPPARAVGMRVVTVLASTGYMCRSRVRVMLHIDDGDGLKISDRRNYVRVNENFSLDLASLLESDPDETVTWRLNAELPAWLKFDGPRGLLSGTPKAGAAGAFELPVSAATSSESGTGTVRIYVMPPPSGPPPAFLQEPLQFGEVCAGEEFQLDLNQYVSNPSGQRLFFGFQDGSEVPPWLTLSDEGGLGGTPTKWAIGTHLLGLDAFDGSNLISGHATIKVTDCD
jgi:hypothetical protein